MRRVLLLVLLAACAKLPDASKDHLSLPDASGFTAARDAEGRLIVAVTRDGRVLHAGKAVTLDELAAILDKAEFPKVVFRVDADARWCHVQWALSVVAAKAYEPVGFVVEDRGRERTLIAHCSPVHPVIGQVYYSTFGARVTVRSQEHGVYSVGARKTKSLRQVRRWIRDISEIAPPALFAIEARLKTPVIECLSLLKVFHEMQEKAVLLSLHAPHPWIREQRRLPEPRENYWVTKWFITDLTYKDVAPMCLPVASMAAEDRDNNRDARLIINLDKHGQILWCGEPKSLDDMRKILDEQKRLYDLRQKAKGKSGYEGATFEREWSRLFVLLRADKDAPWLHVKWILSLLEEERIFKLQFGVMKFADLSYTPEEARALGVARRDELPSAARFLDAKLWCFLSTAEPAPRDIFIDVDLDGTDLEAARREIEKQWKGVRGKGRRVKGRISASDRTPFKRVVAYVNAFHEVGVDKVDFTGIERAPREVASAKKLPR